MYQINFTDGTFITAFDPDATLKPYDGLDHTYAIPNAIVLRTSVTFNVTKYDYDGNKWQFIHEADPDYLRIKISNDGVQIANLASTSSGYNSYTFLYSKSSGVFDIRASNGMPGSGTPYVRQDNSYFLRINFFNGIGNSTYPTVGDAIVSGQTRSNLYTVSNVLPSQSFIDSLTAFYRFAETYTSTYYETDLFASSSGGYASATLNLSDNTVKDYEPEIIVSDDPYAPGGTNDNDPDKVGGEGDFTDQDEATPLPDLPDLSAIDTGLVTVYNPSNADLKNLANYLWSDLFSLDTFKKLFADPMDAILGLSIVPVQPPVSGSAQVTVGNIGTGVSMPKVSNQYVRVDCGSLNVKEYWGAYLDYAPYTKAEIYLPYIGIRPMNIDDVMKKNIHVYYHVDVLSGGCVCFVYSGDKIAYTYAGSCASAIPISGTDWTNVINGVLSAAGAIGATVATGGMAAPMAVGTIASTAVNASKPNVEKSGGMSGAAGLLSYQKPFIILTRPRQAMSKKQYEYMGYPSWASRDISALNGYIEVEYVHLDSINATQEELDEIHQLLTTGVIV